jgi:glutamate-1-semialdehyde 2,1-aminomutase
MRRSLKKSNEQFQRANKSLPLGVTSNFRYWGEEETIYVKRAKGARFWDLDDNEYIDYRLGYGPAILGYADPRVDAAAREGMDVGGVFALATQREATVAERICKMVPSVDLVRFSNSGTEAVMAALRLARAYTGKDSYILCEGGYHGMFDAAMWAANIEEMTEGEDPEIVSFGSGVPDLLRQLLHIVPLNDANRLEDLLKREGDKIGAFLIEPIMGNCGSIMAQQQYVQDARALCTAHDVVMIIDEVKTGFRVAKGGVQELMGIEADVCTFAKAVANGYPISVLAGREDIMRKISEDGVAHGGTYTAHSVTIAAAEKTLEILDETDALAQIADYGTKMAEGMTAILSKRGIAHNWAGHPSMYGLFLCEDAPTNYRDWLKTDSSLYESIAKALLDLGILCEPDNREPFFLSTAHDDACLTETLEKFEIAVDEVLKEA